MRSEWRRSRVLCQGAGIADGQALELDPQAIDVRDIDRLP